MVVLCDEPNFTWVCASGIESIFNGAPCTLAVEPRSWSSVKSLFD